VPVDRVGAGYGAPRCVGDGDTVTWLGLLIAVAVAIALVAVVGAGPKGGRPVGRTGLMSGARVVLLVTVALVAWALWTQ
jgi:hypothetical protein